MLSKTTKMRNFRSNYEPKYFGINRIPLIPPKRLFNDCIIRTTFKDIYDVLEKQKDPDTLYSYSPKIKDLDNSKF